jgi:hypothetical protein
LKLKVFLEYLASFLFLSGLVLVGGSLGLLSCNVFFGSGFYFAVMFALGLALTITGKGFAWAFCGGENEYE